MAERLEGTVERIRFVNEATHWTVAEIHAPDGTGRAIAVGFLPGLQQDMVVRVDGEWVVDRRYGQQFRAQSFTELVPATEAGLKAYLASGFIKGIGAKMAARIVDRFGAETLDVIADQPERLTEIAGLGQKRVRTIVEAFHARRGAQEALVFLYGLGITPGLAAKIYQRYGDDTVRLVRSNPYRLAEEVHGVGFFKADQVAAGLDIAENHPARTRAGVYHVLLEARGEGHCFVPRAELGRLAQQLLAVADLDIAQAITQLALDRRVVIDRPDGAGHDDAVYLAALFDAEVGVAQHLAALLDARSRRRDPAADVQRAGAHIGLQLAPGQRAAVELALTAGTAIITGGPGTGKTTIIRTLIAAWGLRADRVALAAPTGRAAKRMAEATGHEARTIHRLLEFSPADGCFQRDETDPLDVDLVIIDEASMLDLPLCYALARAIPSDAALVLVGDADQLPPVGPGAPFTDLIRSGAVPVARLTEIFRQGAGSTIVAVAHRINHGGVPQPTGPGTPLQDFYFIERAAPEDVLATIEELVIRRIPGRFQLDPVADIQVLAPMRGGIIGVDNLNRRLQELLNPDGESITVGSVAYRVGDKVMQIRNDYERNVFNGDVGTVHRVRARDRQLSVVIDGREVPYERDQLDELAPAYAVSIHKSQGSEYPAVVIPISTQHFKMLQRNLVYTGVTRGTRLVVLVGTRRALRIAVSRSEIAARHSALAARLTRARRGELRP